MHLDILTPDKKVFSGEVVSVNFPGSAGYFEVHTNHAPLISTLDKGNIKIRSSNKEEIIQVDGGVVEVLHNNITVLAEAVIGQ